MARENVIPHFHGVSFLAAEMTQNEAFAMYNALSSGQQKYYSETILRNAVINFKDPISAWKQKIMDDYYVEDMRRIFTDIISPQLFYAFQQQYVTKFKNGADKIDENIQQVINNDPILRDFWFLSPESANYLKQIKENRSAREFVKGKKNSQAAAARANLDAENEVLEKEYRKARRDSFVATSKLPRHPIQFAVMGIQAVLNDYINSQSIHFIGLVLTNLIKQNDYPLIPHFDVLSAMKARFMLGHARYKYQAEVDFINMVPSIVFPIILPSTRSVWTPDIQRYYGFSEVDFNSLKCSLVGIPNDEKKIVTKLEDWYSDYIARSISSIAQRHQFNLIYIKPNGEPKVFFGNVMNMQRDIINGLEEQVLNNLFYNSPLPPTPQEMVLTLRNNAQEADKSIVDIINASQNEEEARGKLSKPDSPESYETVTIDRRKALKHSLLPREQRDEKLAKALQKIEKKRFESFQERVALSRKDNLVQAGI